MNIPCSPDINGMNKKEEEEGPPVAPNLEEIQKVFIKERKKEVNDSSGEEIPIDFEKYHESFDIDRKIEWGKIKNVNITDSDSGSNGVFFVQTNGNEIFVLKGSDLLAEEIFCSIVGIELLSLKTPKIKLIEYHPKNSVNYYGYDWDSCRIVMRKLAEKNLRLKVKFEANFNRAFYHKMEFIYGKTLYNVKDINKYSKDFGRIFVFDILINNYDRFPCSELCWKSLEGNEMNFLFSDDGCYAIDQSLLVITNKENAEKYFDCIKNFVNTHFNEKDLTKNIFIQRIVSFLNKITSQKINDYQLIWDGMDEIIQKIRKITINDLKTIYKRVVAMKTGRDWENVYTESCRRIDLKFLMKIINIFNNKNN